MDTINNIEEEIKMKDNTTFANLLSIGGTTMMVAIAGFSLPVSLAIIGASTVGCAYLTLKDSKK